MQHFKGMESRREKKNREREVRASVVTCNRSLMMLRRHQ